MSAQRYIFFIKNSRTFTIQDTTTQGILTFNFFGEQDGEENPMIDLHNQILDSIYSDQTLLLELYGNSVINWTEEPMLSGSVSLNSTTLSNPHLENVELINCKIINFETVIISFSKLRRITNPGVGKELLCKFTEKAGEWCSAPRRNYSQNWAFGTRVHRKD